MDNFIPITWLGRRIIPSRFPPVALFERILDPSEFEAAYFIESLTNERLRDQVGDISLVPAKERVTGPGSTPIMAAFTHIGNPSRFTDGSYGVYYCANDSATAIAETAFHRAKFLSATNEPDTRIFMREYVGQIVLPMLDVTGAQYIDIHNPDDYQLSQSFARKHKDEDVPGLLYNSVRNKGGLCVAAFKANAMASVTQAAHYEYVYSATLRSIKHVLVVKQFDPSH
ncbi:RES family NAD+ phosphorylase [Rheinheimera sp.]|uniref:RES family NAD+ phosphorylase n=1 Tax=Rheinheimera sp. TaxID=1869214 RepID=UPI0040486FDD